MFVSPGVLVGLQYQSVVALPKEDPVRPRCILTLRGCTFGEFGVQKWLELRSLLRNVSSPSLTFSHRQNANCKLDALLSSSEL